MHSKPIALNFNLEVFREMQAVSLRYGSGYKDNDERKTRPIVKYQQDIIEEAKNSLK